MKASVCGGRDRRKREQIGVKGHSIISVSFRMGIAGVIENDMSSADMCEA